MARIRCPWRLWALVVSRVAASCGNAFAPTGAMCDWRAAVVAPRWSRWPNNRRRRDNRRHGAMSALGRFADGVHSCIPRIRLVTGPLAVGRLTFHCTDVWSSTRTTCGVRAFAHASVLQVSSGPWLCMFWWLGVVGAEAPEKFLTVESRTKSCSSRRKVVTNHWRSGGILH